jgi:DNA-binding PadR family transcriptional regulator
VPRSRSPDELLPLTPLSIAILLVLADGPLHGYGLIKALELETEGRIVPAAGTLYAALQRMVDEQLIEEADAPDTPEAGQRRRYYALTDFGRDVARAELRRLSRLLALGSAKRLAPGLLGGRT